jgi:hypothetical protein
MSSYGKIAGKKKATQHKTKKMFAKTDAFVKAASANFPYTGPQGPHQPGYDHRGGHANVKMQNYLNMDCLVFYGKNAKNEEWTSEELLGFLDTSYTQHHEDNFFRARKINSFNEVSKNVVHSDFPWMRGAKRKFYIESEIGSPGKD